MMEANVFDTMYGQYFSGLLYDMPYVAKYRVREFLHSEDGREFNFVKGRQNEYPCALQGSFTGKDMEEVVCVMSNEHYFAGDAYRQMILVFACNEGGDYRLIYKESFREVIQVGRVYPDAEERWDADVYQDSEEKQPLPFDGVRIRRAGLPDIVLVYNQSLDSMGRYVQLPLSELKEGNEGKGNEDKRVAL
ncbi:hypothetical protein SAMN05421788_109235 [Filimonas lacunae]|uniref:Uncharacterized protein n=1 Tax=Filimonas lacunae TaxID=477680 RepID=A0A173MIV9_9BACT|nr:hypothetical protein [Filimonas lacunae]BAV07406.1 hypothetical protein FLA_3431 [Filimonas lacunae]SIT30478.1 hypothetical protein SAMN05421788_109235 [Filimonas lacunae]